MSTASERLRGKLDLAYPLLRVTAEKIWSGPRVRELYPVYLATMHGIVRSAVPLIDAAAERARELDDPVARALVPYFEHHGPEEAGHDVWLLEDLEALGGDRAAAAAAIPTANVAEMVGAQYYWLRHVHPVSLLGHMAVVEGYSPDVGFSNRLQEATGYPADAFRAIRRHERLDIRHKRELYEAIDALALDESHEALMGLSGLHTIQSAAKVFAQIGAARPVELV
jgi:hypothetical protein